MRFLAIQVCADELQGFTYHCARGSVSRCCSCSARFLGLAWFTLGLCCVRATAFDDSISFSLSLSLVSEGIQKRHMSIAHIAGTVNAQDLFPAPYPMAPEKNGCSAHKILPARTELVPLPRKYRQLDVFPLRLQKIVCLLRPCERPVLVGRPMVDYDRCRYAVGIFRGRDRIPEIRILFRRAVFRAHLMSDVLALFHPPLETVAIIHADRRIEDIGPDKIRPHHHDRLCDASAHRVPQHPD